MNCRTLLMIVSLFLNSVYARITRTMRKLFYPNAVKIGDVLHVPYYYEGRLYIVKLPVSIEYIDDHDLEDQYANVLTPNVLKLADEASGGG